MHETAAGERNHLRLQRPPVRERSRPLAGAPHLVHLLAREDDAAVDDPDDDRRELLGGDGDHRLVEQGETLSYPSVPDQHVALPVDREREQVAVLEAFADVNGFACSFGGRGEVPGRLVLEHRRQEQVAALGTLPLVLEEPLCAAQPARRRSDLPTGRKVQADPQRAPDSPQRRPALEVPLMRALEPRNRFVVATEHERAGRQELDIRRAQRRVPLLGTQRLVCLEPRLLRVGLTAASEGGSALHPRHSRSGRRIVLASVRCATRRPPDAALAQAPTSGSVS